MANSAAVDGQISTSATATATAEAEAEAGAEAAEEEAAASSPLLSSSRSLVPGRRRRNRPSSSLSSSSSFMTVLAALVAAATSAAGAAAPSVVMTTTLLKRWCNGNCGGSRRRYCAGGRPFTSVPELTGRSWRRGEGGSRWSSSSLSSALCFVTTARPPPSVGAQLHPLHQQRRWRRTSAEAWPQPHHNRSTMMMSSPLPSPLSPSPHPGNGNDVDGDCPQPQQQQQQQPGAQEFPDEAATAVAAAAAETHRPLSPLARAIRDQVERVAMAAAQEAAQEAAQAATTTTAAAAAVSPPLPAATDVTVVLVLSVSGGCDSVAMFHACMEWVASAESAAAEGERAAAATEDTTPPSIQLDVHVVHFHHRQRPGEADGDCHFVRDLVERANRDNERRNNSNNSNSIINSRPTNVTFHVEDWNDVDVAPLSSLSPPSVSSSEAEAETAGLNYHEKDIVVATTATTTTTTTTTTPADGQTAATPASFSQDRARQWRRSRLEAYTQAQVVGRVVAEEHATASEAGAKAEANATTAGEAAAGRTCNNDDDDDDDEDEDDKATTHSERRHHPPHDTERVVVVGMVLTAHHRDDSQESLVLKMLRGVHLLNLEGMEAVTALDGNGESGDCSRSHGGDGTHGNRIYLLRPWLDYSKLDLVRYLTDRGLTWREDSSNASTGGKYLRNRVRHELLPLLQDLTDGAFLDRRLPAWTAQAAELRNDVLPRVRAYLDRHTVRGTGTGGGTGGEAEHEFDGCEFWLAANGPPTGDAPTTPVTASRLVTSQALYQWIAGQIHVQNGSRRKAAAVQASEYLSYETLQRVVHQLEAYPTRMQWTLELGSGWNVVRLGNVLRVVYVDDGPAAEKASTLNPWSWTTLKRVAPDEQIGAADCGPIEIFLPPNMLGSDLSFFSTTLGHAVAILPVTAAVEPNVDKSWLWFVPPWKGSPVKLRQFLRGQHISLHLRDDVPLLFARITASPTAGPNGPLRQDGYRLVAVRVKDQWVIHKDYCGAGDKSMTSTSSVFLYPTC